MNQMSLVLLAVNVIILGISIYLATQVRALKYLIEQPVVKKMPPNLKFKPRSVEGSENTDPRNADRNRPTGPSVPGQQNRPPMQNRPQGSFQGGRPDRNDQRRDRPMNDRPERTERSERPEGDRPERTERPERHGMDRGDRNRPGNRRPPRFDRNNQTRGTVMGNEATDEERQAPVQAGAPIQASTERVQVEISNEARTLPARESKITLSETPQTEVRQTEAPAPEFVGSGDEVQHGRRIKIRKPPSFDEGSEG